MASGFSLIADSGATKTNWLLHTPEGSYPMQTMGFHPARIDNAPAASALSAVWPDHIPRNLIGAVHFYGSGCLREPGNSTMRGILSGLFPEARINVRSDLEGAAISTLGKFPGLAAILGTGASAARWSGQQLTHVSPSLGFLLGDEGSGADLGRVLLRDVLYGQAPDELQQAFRTRNPYSWDELLHGINTSPHPAHLLGQYALMLGEMADHPYVRGLVRARFQAFTDQHLLKLDPDRSMSVGFNGSVAWTFSELLQEVMESSGFRNIVILRDPLPALSLFHQKGTGI